jgi:hypothetical protein
LRRPFNHQNLISADTEASIRQLTPLLPGQINRLPDCVDHDEIVTRAVHFGELQFHGSVSDL